MISSCTDCSAVIHASIGDALPRILRCRARNGTREDCAALVTLMGISERLLQRYVDMDIWFDGSFLKVNKNFRMTTDKGVLPAALWVSGGWLGVTLVGQHFAGRLPVCCAPWRSVCTLF